MTQLTTFRRSPWTLLVVALTLLTFHPLKLNAHSDPLPDSAQRIDLIDQIGGAITAALPLPDGTILAAQEAQLVHLQLSGAATTELDILDPDIGTILDIQANFPLIIALGETGLASLIYEDDHPRLTDTHAGGGLSLVLHQDRVAIAAFEAGIRTFSVDSSGRFSQPTNLDLRVPILDLTFDPTGQSLYAAAGDAGVFTITRTDSANLVISDQIDYRAQSVTFVGSLLALTTDGTLTLLDPTTQRVIGRYDPLHAGRRLVVADGFAYIADEHDGLKIFLLADVDRPLQIYGERESPLKDLTLNGDTLYAVGPGSLRIYDVGNRYQPVIRQQIELPGEAQGIALSPDRAYVAMGDDGIGVINLGTGSLEKRIPLDTPAHALVYYRGWLYVAADEAGLVTIDAQQTGAETVFAALPLSGPALDLDRRGTGLFVAAGDAGLLALNITRPGAPFLSANLPSEPGRSFQSISISGARAYVAYGDGFIVADVNRSDSLGRLARVTTPTRALAADGISLYALDARHITIYDIRATAEPVLLNQYLPPTSVTDLTSADNLLFLTQAGAYPGLIILNASTPDFIIESAITGQQANAYHASPTAGNVFLSGGRAGLTRIALNQNGAVAASTTYAALPDALKLAAYDDQLLVGGYAGWALLNRTPSLSAQTGSPTPLTDITASGRRIAVATDTNTIQLYELDDSGQPQLIATHDTAGHAAGIALEGEFVYVADASSLSILDPRFLEVVRRVTTPAPATDLIIVDNIAYLTLTNQQLAIIEIGNPTGGIRLLNRIETRRPSDLIPAPDGLFVYALADNTLNRLTVEPPDTLFIDQRGFIPQAASHGQFVGSFLALLDEQGEGELYDLALLEESVLPRGLIDLSLAFQTLVDSVIQSPYAFAAYGGQGLALVDLRTPGEGFIFDPAPTDHVLLDGSRLYATGLNKLTIFDVTEPSRPQTLQTLDLPSLATSLALSPDGNLLVGLSNGISILSTQNGLEPIRHIFLQGQVDHIAQVGDRVLLGMREGGLHIIDLSDPAQPTSLFSTTSPSGRFVHDLLPLNDSQVMVSWETGIDIIDVSAIANAPNLLSTIPLSDTPRTLTLSADKLLIAYGTSGLDIYNRTAPTNLTLEAHIDSPGTVESAALQDSTLALATGECGLRIIDLSDPTSPHETAYWLGDYASDVLAIDDLFYLADTSRVVALHYDPDAPSIAPPLPQSPTPADQATGILLEPILSWTPPDNPCQTLTYDIYFGAASDPAFAGQITGLPRLELSELDPLRTYFWRVDVTDNQGDRITGPEWTFTTISAELIDTVPPAPPPFIERVRQSPAALLTILGAGLALAVWALYRRYAPPSEPNTTGSIPDWYVTGDDIDLD